MRRFNLLEPCAYGSGSPGELSASRVAMRARMCERIIVISVMVSALLRLRLGMWWSWGRNEDEAAPNRMQTLQRPAWPIYRIV